MANQWEPRVEIVLELLTKKRGVDMEVPEVCTP
jgi:hypothetical protein